LLSRIALLAACVCGLAAYAGSHSDWLVAMLTASPAGSAAVATAPSQAARPHQATLRIGADGHALFEAVVNGNTIQMMLDTGASVVALTGSTARRMGIDPSASEYNVVMNTANGNVRGARVTLREVRIGDVIVNDVAAVVMPDKALGVNLLGMSFLNRLQNFASNGREYVLTR
jgi:aspartyl protease family protein